MGLFDPLELTVPTIAYSVLHQRKLSVSEEEYVKTLLELTRRAKERSEEASRQIREWRKAQAAHAGDANFDDLLQRLCPVPGLDGALELATVEAAFPEVRLQKLVRTGREYLTSLGFRSAEGEAPVHVSVLLFTGSWNYDLVEHVVRDLMGIYEYPHLQHVEEMGPVIFFTQNQVAAAGDPLESEPGEWQPSIFFAKGPPPWVIGAVVILFLALVHAELGGMFPVSGGSGRYPHYAFGSLGGFASGWFWYLGAVTVAPAELEAALTYANNWFPNTFHFDLIASNGALTAPGGYIIAALLMILFTVINVLGVRWLTNTNTLVVAAKIAVPVLTVIVFLAMFHHFDNLTSHGFAPNGVAPIFAALSSGIIFAYLGFEQAVEFGAESHNPTRNIPLAVIGSMIIGIVVYLGLAIAFATSFDPSALSKGWSNLSFPGSYGPNAAIASAAGLGWLATILYADAFVSPAGTGLLYVGSSARMSFGMARNRYIPGFFEDISERRVPLIGLVVAMVLGFLFLLPFPSWQILIGIITSATVLSYGLQPLALGALRRQVPDLERPYVCRWLRSSPRSRSSSPTWSSTGAAGTLIGS